MGALSRRCDGGDVGMRAAGERGAAGKDENTCRCEGRRCSDACGEEGAGGSEQRRTVGTFRISSVSKVRASTTCSSDVCWIEMVK